VVEFAALRKAGAQHLVRQRLIKGDRMALTADELANDLRAESDD